LSKSSHLPIRKNSEWEAKTSLKSHRQIHCNSTQTESVACRGGRVGDAYDVSMSSMKRENVLLRGRHRSSCRPIQALPYTKCRHRVRRIPKLTEYPRCYPPEHGPLLAVNPPLGRVAPPLQRILQPLVGRISQQTGIPGLPIADPLMLPRWLPLWRLEQPVEGVGRAVLVLADVHTDSLIGEPQKPC
jgi:hypothetical protein